MRLVDVTQVLAGYPDTRLIEAAGDFFAIHDPDNDYEQRPRQGWATVVTSDSGDTDSDLSRPGVFRLNIGLSKARFDALIEPETEYDLTALDVLFPHPVYRGYHYVCVLNPDRSWPLVRELLDDAHDFAVRKHRNASSRRNGAT